MCHSSDDIYFSRLFRSNSPVSTASEVAKWLLRDPLGSEPYGRSSRGGAASGSRAGGCQLQVPRGPVQYESGLQAIDGKPIFRQILCGEQPRYSGVIRLVRTGEFAPGSGLWRDRKSEPKGALAR